MRRALPLALAAALLLVPAVPGASADRYGKHRRAHKRHHRDQRVVMPGRRPPAPKPKPLTRMQVVAREFSLALSRHTVGSGTVVIELDNHGEDPHDLRVEPAGSALPAFDFALTRPGGVTTRTLELGPGTWRLYCTLEGHAALGMSATVTVGG